jgi:hypothetical protein
VNVTGDPTPGTVLVAAGNTTRSGLSVNFAHGNLQVAPDGKHLRHTDGTPFFYLADACWTLLWRMTRADIDFYLENRRSKGFTVIQIQASNQWYSDRNPPNVEGNRPFFGSTGSAPNPAWFGLLDYLVDKAASMGMYIGIAPWWVGLDKPWTEIDRFGSGNYNAGFSYGLFIGQRYANRPNIIWLIGGDGPIDDHGAGAIPIHEGIRDGIRSGDGGKFLLMWHPGYLQGRGAIPPWSQIQINTYQFSIGFGGPEFYTVGEGMYGQRKPNICIETSYEHNPHTGQVAPWNSGNGRCDSFDVRYCAYTSLMNGACGFGGYGQQAVFSTADGNYPPGYNISANISPLVAFWNQPAAIDAPGSWSVSNMRKLFDSHPFGALIPDQGLVNNTLSGMDRIQCARGGDYAYIYSGTGRSFTVNMGRIRGAEVKAYWFDPRNGQVSFINRYTNSGTRTFDPPGSPARANDWVLILDDANANYPTPSF